MPVIENLGQHFPNMAPREFGGTVLLPGSVEEMQKTPEGQRTLSHEAVHAFLSQLAGKATEVSPMLGAGVGLGRVAMGSLPDALNPEEELAYQLEQPRDESVLRGRRDTRRSLGGPVAAFLRGLYGDSSHNDVQMSKADYLTRRASR